MTYDATFTESETYDDQNHDVIVWTYIAGSWSNATGVRSRADVDYLISCWTDRGLRPFGGHIYRIIHASEGPPKPLGVDASALPEPRQVVTPAGTAYLLPGIEPAPVAQKGGGYQGRLF